MGNEMANNAGDAQSSEDGSTAPDDPTNVESPATQQPWAPRHVDRAHLPNAYYLDANVISGGQPEGEEGYRELSELGVKTVISVDGAQPRVELAKKHGLSYVHLPHGYDGVPEQRAQELSKAVRDLPGPIYIHCHHGKHRSPAAATVACIGAGLLDQELGLTVLQTAGTSQNYQGLYESVNDARPLDSALLDALSAEFPEQMDVPPMAEAMVAIEHGHDHLKAIQEAAWETPPAHPDLDPPHEALLLSEHFTELLRTEETLQQPARFQELLRDSEKGAQQLEAALRAWTDHSQPAPEAIESSFTRITNNCKACHHEFRDVPLREKQSASP
jgi:protein tyrosine phosphatase (PTP) superfamily phosphohydrolase (DUF442 family)